MSEPVWTKIKTGHYVHTTDDGYEATVRKDERGGGGRWMWTAEAVSPTGRSCESPQWHDSMADAREWVIGDGYYIKQGWSHASPFTGISDLRLLDKNERRYQDEIQRITEQLRDDARHTMSVDTAVVGENVWHRPNKGLGRSVPAASFHIHGDSDLNNVTDWPIYKVTVKLVKESA